jgi:hypothetical protein
MSPIDIEKLVAWAFFELDKGGTQAWSPWDLIRAYGKLGRVIDDQFGSVFRLPAFFGDAHPDARIVGKAVANLDHPACALVESHGRALSRPKLVNGPIRIYRIYKGTQPLVIGSSYGRSANGKWRYYHDGAYCPLRYVPTVEKLEASRAEYTAWRDGLVRLVSQLSGQLRDYVPTGPSAPAEPWINPAPPMRVLYAVKA